MYAANSFGAGCGLVVDKGDLLDGPWCAGLVLVVVVV